MTKIEELQKEIELTKELIKLKETQLQLERQLKDLKGNQFPYNPIPRIPSTGDMPFPFWPVIIT